MVHPIWIREGAADWQVFPRSDRSARVILTGGRDPQRAPKDVYVRCVSERDGAVVCPWTAAQTPEDTCWTAELALPVGGPYRIETCAKLPEQLFGDAIGGDIRQHVFAGDLYLIAGQSNAAGYARDSVPDAPCIGVSVLRLSGRWDMAAHPLNDGTDSIRDNMELPMPAHSPWLTFGRTLYYHSGVPVGLIPAALGGSPLDSWLPGGMLFENAIRVAGQAGRLAGVLWYQGCTDALEYRTEDYLQRFEAMVAAFREKLGQPRLPVFTCQLNGYMDSSTKNEDLAWAAVRQAQEEATRDEWVFMLPTAGFELYDAIHNNARSNLMIGRQMAMQAFANLYGGKVRWASPRVVGVERQPDRLILTLSPMEGAPAFKKNAAEAFRAEKGDVPLPITALRTEGKKLVLEGPGLHGAEVISYAQTRDLSAAGIYDKRGHWLLAPFQWNIR